MIRAVEEWIDLKKPAGWVTAFLAAFIIFAFLNNPSKEDFVRWCDVTVVEQDGSESTTEQNKLMLMHSGVFDRHLQRLNCGLFSVFDYDWEGRQAKLLGIAGRFYTLWDSEEEQPQAAQAHSGRGRQPGERPAR
jgi:hypothetical protein